MRSTAFLNTRCPATLLLCLSALSPACNPEAEETAQISLASVEGRTGTVSLAVMAQEGDGEAIRLTPSNSSVLVETRPPDGEWIESPSAELDYQGPSRLDIVVVADNSGSEEGYLSTMQESIVDLSHLMLARGQRDRVGLVRVSTEATTYAELSEEQQRMEEASGQLFINKGWTALWDGIRLANEVLERASVVPTPRGNRPRVCVDRAFRGIVAFTDGMDNNSADEHDTPYLGDGIDTTFEMLTELSVHGTDTPVYTVGIGEAIDADALGELADATGGTFSHLGSMGQLHGELISTAARLKSQVPLCFEVPDCGHTEARITLSVTHRGNESVVTLPLALPVDTCSSK